MIHGKSPVCPKCGRALRGVTIIYGSKWECSDCVEDRSDPIHCEAGSRVRFAHPDNGREIEREEANRLLTEGATYEVETVHVGGCCSEIELKEIPGGRFNSVFFQRVQ